MNETTQPNGIPPHVLKVKRYDGFTQVLTNYGWGDQLSYSTPTGNQAAYAEAIESNRIHSERNVSEYIAKSRTHHPNLIVVDPLLDNARQYTIETTDDATPGYGRLRRAAVAELGGDTTCVHKVTLDAGCPACRPYGAIYLPR